jgi:PAS domain S-box-containing protein
MRFWKRSLMVQMVGYFLLLSLGTVSAICCVAFLQSRASLKESIIKQLYLTADLKEDELNRWVNDQGEEVRTLIKTPEVRTLAPLLLQDNETGRDANRRLSGLFSAIAAQHSSLDEIMIVTKGGRVLLSTEPSRQGAYEAIVQYSYLPAPQVQFAPNFYPSPTTGDPRMTFAAPLEDAAGQEISILAIHLNLSRIDEILRKRPGLGKTGETYLVGNTLPNQGGNLKRYNLFVSGHPSREPQGIYSQGIALASQGRAGSGVYRNYRGEEVVGVYRWLGKHDLALLVEMTTQEAFAPAKRLAQTIFTTGLGLVTLMAMIVYWGTQRIARPILAITQTATQVAAGNLDSMAPVFAPDEIGTLAVVFNQMIEQLRVLYTKLETKVAERTTELTEMNQKLQVEVGDRKHAEEILKQQQEFLRTVIDTDPNLIFVKDWEGRYLLANQATADFYDLTVDQLLGQKDIDLHPSSAAVTRFLQENQHVIETQQELFIAEEKIALTDKSEWLQWQKRPLHLPGSPIRSVLGIGVNITERKHLEEQLRQSQQFLDSIINSLPLALYVKDVQNDFRYVLVSRNSERILGFSPQEAIGRCDYEMIATEQADYHLQEDLTTLQTGTLVELAEHWIERSGEDRFMVRGWKLPLFDAQGHPSHILGISEDVTDRELERNQVEASLVLAKDAAEAANRAKSAFLANMSHELRTPLNTILGFSQLMERDPLLTSSQKEFLATINQSGEHLLNLINDVLEMSKIEAGRIVLNTTTVDLHHLLQTLQEMFQVRIQAKQLSLEFRLDPNLPQHILIDEGKLRQVLINLLENAVKFTQAGHVLLQVTQIQQQPSPVHTLCFEVQDTGCGIDAAHLGQLFQPFSGQGTGLGLAISRQFIRLMGGEIQVSSSNHGTTFRFEIPVSLANPLEVLPLLPTKRVLHIAPHQPSSRILVVDDRPENRDLMVRLLDMVGFETQTADNGEEAIAQWQSWQPHLIWMDMRMPVMDGYEAVRRIRAQEVDARVMAARVKIIALTASAFEEQQTSILEAGCDDLVCKPYKEAMIFEKIALHLGTQYLYAEPSPLWGQASSITAENLTSEHLVGMPLGWITQLHQAALRTDEQAILNLLQQIPLADVAIAHALSDLVHNFRCDKIMDSTQPLLAAHDS